MICAVIAIGNGFLDLKSSGEKGQTHYIGLVHSKIVDFKAGLNYMFEFWNIKEVQDYSNKFCSTFTTEQYYMNI